MPSLLFPMELLSLGLLFRSPLCYRYLTEGQILYLNELVLALERENDLKGGSSDCCYF